MNIGKGQDPNATIGKLPDSSSNHRHPAVDVQGLPGDVSGLVTSQIDARAGDIIG